LVAYLLCPPCRMVQTQYSAWQLLLPFTLLDSNIYIENCALYLGSSLFVVYLLYFKTTA